MTPINAVGLLGISGKYGYVSIEDQTEVIEYILNHYDLIDTASVYGESWAINPVLANMRQIVLKNKYAPILVNKIGADLQASNSFLDIVKEYERQKMILENYPCDFLLLHRPAKHLLERDIRFHEYIKRQGETATFGISTNSLSILKLYHNAMPVDVVQVAVNLLDYMANKLLLEFCAEHKIIVHARSVLSSGLLSGTYVVNKLFDFVDPLRSRYTESDNNRRVLNSRLEKVEIIKSYYHDYISSNIFIAFPDFVYGIMQASPFVDVVIKGGSSLEQIQKNNCAPYLFSREVLSEIFDVRISEWSADYL
jgi:aryl-alcohol dehydrogenase-like predicted oxidoreductase